MDKIMAHGMTFLGCHGVLPQEKSTPQKFIVDLDLYLDFTEAARNDDLSLTINYDKVFHMVKEIVESKSYNLIETLANSIARVVIDEFPVQIVEVTVKKPDAPIRGDFAYFAVKVKKIRK
jgi:dihydroneopterin aldolase